MGKLNACTLNFLKIVEYKFVDAKQFENYIIDIIRGYILVQILLYEICELNFKSFKKGYQV